MHIYFKLYTLLFSTNTKAFVVGGVLINAINDNVQFIIDNISLNNVVFSTLVFSGKCILGGFINLCVKKVLDIQLFKGGKNEQH